MRIGIDLDNTLISYDSLFLSLARKMGASLRADSSKEDVKSWSLDQDPSGEQWRELQSLAYGPRVLEAPIFPGARECLTAWLQSGHTLTVCSHKTEKSAFDPEIKLRDWAALWLQQNLKEIPRSSIFFCETLEEKIQKIDDLNLDFFIDDHLHVLKQPQFPPLTGRVWFNPEKSEVSPEALIRKNITSFPVWNEIQNWFQNFSLLDDREVSAIKQAACEFGFPVSIDRPARFQGNNRLFNLKRNSKKSWVLKHYRITKDDPRPRGQTEFDALNIMRSYGIQNVPEPIWLTPDQSIGFYEFMEGSKTDPENASKPIIDQTALFLHQLDQMSRSVSLETFSYGAHSRKSVRDYFTVIDERLGKILPDLKNLPLGGEAKTFLNDLYLPELNQIKIRAQSAFNRNGIPLDQPTDKSELMLCPSDFGFHNMLVHEDSLHFLDFEYFGWDDPAKLMSDFMHSVAFKLDLNQRAQIVAQFGKERKNPISFFSRLSSVADLIGAEWILIILNVFNEDHLKRRLFANPHLKAEDLLAERLERAAAKVKNWPRNEGGFWTLNVDPKLFFN